MIKNKDKAPRLMLSRFRGKCEECGKPINRGRPIVWSRRDGAGHAECRGWTREDADKELSSRSAAAIAEVARPVRVPAVVVVADGVPAEPDWITADESGFWDSLCSDMPA